MSSKEMPNFSSMCVRIYVCTCVDVAVHVCLSVSLCVCLYPGVGLSVFTISGRRGIQETTS